MNEWIELADKTKVEDSYVIKLSDEAIAICSASIHNVRDMWALFSDSCRTASMHSWQYGDEADWIGFTEPTSIQMNTDNTITICLAKAGES